MIPFFIPLSSGESESQGGYLNIKITKITLKSKYGSFQDHRIYDVLYADYSNDSFLVIDDDKDFIWVPFSECKAAL